MEKEIDLDLKEKNLKNLRTDVSKKINKILKYQDVCVILFKLKNFCKKLDDATILNFDEIMMINFYNFVIKLNFLNLNFSPVDLDYDNFLNKFCKKIKTDNNEYLIKALPYINCDIDYYRELFGYSKIYKIYTTTIQNIFNKEASVEYLNLLIKLLNNEKLAYKSILPILKKVNLFLKQKSVEKNIVDCCTVITAVSMNCANFIENNFNISLISYLIQIFYDPQNFIFLNFEESKIISNCISKCLINCKNCSGTKNFAIGIYREVSAKIKEYSKSTVYEEACVVAFLTEILSYILELNFKINKNNLKFIKIEIFDFEYLQRKNNLFKINAKNPEILYDNKISEANKNYTSSIYKDQYQILVDYFYTYKYKFMDLIYDNFTLDFDRIVFYNDLSKMKNTQFLFKVTNKIKNFIDWSDMIVFACKAKKEFYLNLIFDKIYISNPAHIFYLKIFLKNLESNIEENNKVLTYFTKYILKYDIYDLISHIFLIGIENEDNISRKRRFLIFEYLNNIKDTCDINKNFNTNKKFNTNVNLKTNKNFNTNKTFETNKIYDNINSDKIANNEDINICDNITNYSSSKCQISNSLSKNDSDLETLLQNNNNMKNKKNKNFIKNKINANTENLDKKYDANKSDNLNYKNKINEEFIIKDDKVLYNIHNKKPQTKKVTIETEEKNIPGTNFIEIEKQIDVKEIKAKIKKNHYKNIIKNKIEVEKIQIIVKNLIEDDLFKLNKNMIIFLLILASKKIKQDLVINLISKIISNLDFDNLNNEILIYSVCICAVLVNSYKIEYYNNIRKVNDKIDLLIVALCLNKYNSKYKEEIKSQCFDALMKADSDTIKIMQNIFNNKKIEYKRKYKEIIKIIRYEK